MKNLLLLVLLLGSGIMMNGFANAEEEEEYSDEVVVVVDEPIAEEVAVEEESEPFEEVIYSVYLITGQFGSYQGQSLSLNENGGQLADGCEGRAHILEPIIVSDDSRLVTVKGTYSKIGVPSLQGYPIVVTAEVSIDESIINLSFWFEGETHFFQLFLGQDTADILCADQVPSDLDQDGVADADDNCPDNANSSQDDSDSDGVGDACDEADNSISAEEVKYLGEPVAEEIQAEEYYIYCD